MTGVTLISSPISSEPFFPVSIPLKKKNILEIINRKNLRFIKAYFKSRLLKPHTDTKAHEESLLLFKVSIQKSSCITFWESCQLRA